MTTETISAILLGLISLTAGGVVLYWHLATRGTWRRWPAGRSLMGLLSIISIGFGFGAMNRHLGNYPAKFALAAVLYSLFWLALLFIGTTIRAEMRAGKARASAASSTGPVTVAVACTNEESPHE